MSLEHVSHVSDVGEPELALAAGILALAVEDLHRPAHAHNARVFFRSKWCGLLAGGLGIEYEELQERLRRYARQKASPVQQVRRRPCRKIEKP